MTENPNNDPTISGSHAGEDEWILKQFPDGYVGNAVEIGAHDGYYLSNTLLLEIKGWTCLCIEPNPLHHEKLKARRKLVMTCACDDIARPGGMLYHAPNTHMGTLAGLNAGFPGVGQRGVALAEVEVKTLDQCMTEAGFETLDVLSIDVDGKDFEVLEGAKIEKWRPKVVVVEDNDINRMEVEAHMAGYDLGAWLGHNRLWVRRD